ncbi:MAG: AMP-binding protein, partial [Paracoccaceae bacterium]|nr:AMP-binding protein [Paracoccaceae bacterium]
SDKLEEYATYSWGYIEEQGTPVSDYDYLLTSSAMVDFIDEGKPVKGLFDRTIENLKLQTGSIVFNVPVGFGMLFGALKDDADLRQRFFKDLDMIFYAGASLPQDIWKGFEEMALNISGQIPLLTSSWGLTETAPAVLSQHEPTDRAGVIGVPLPGTTLKLIPDADGRCEARVKGPNIMAGYLGNDEKTAEAFDDEGFFITDDAMIFVDSNDVNKGMKFDGRISEDFKLWTGTWVRASGLRADILAVFAPLASDVVITGQDRDEIGVMIFPNREEVAKAGYSEDVEGDIFVCPDLLADFEVRLGDHAAEAAGSSSRVARAVVLAEPPSLIEGEITAKGNLNFSKIQSRRADILNRLYDDTAKSIVKI